MIQVFSDLVFCYGRTSDSLFRNDTRILKFGIISKVIQVVFYLFQQGIRHVISDIPGFLDFGIISLNSQMKPSFLYLTLLQQGIRQ